MPFAWIFGIEMHCRFIFVVSSRLGCSLITSDCSLYVAIVLLVSRFAEYLTHSPGQSDFDISVRTSGGMSFALSMDVLSR